MQNILVATDLSERGDRAVSRAARLARDLGARLLVVTVVDGELPDDIADAYTEGAEAALDRIVAALGKLAKTGYQRHVLRGDPALAIATLAQAEAADLLVIGTHRERPFVDAFRDTTMERVVRQARCPVLIARNPAAGPYRGVVGAVDFSPAAAAALRAAAAIAPKARLCAVHALHIPFKGLMPTETDAPFLREARAAERDWRKSEALPEALDKVEIVEGAVLDVLAEAIRKNGADLVAVGAHAGAGLVTSLLGGFATGLIRNAGADVIVARPG